MDIGVTPTIITVLVNILSNALTQIVLDPTYKGKEPLRPHLETTLTPILQKAVLKSSRFGVISIAFLCQVYLMK